MTVCINECLNDFYLASELEEVFTSLVFGLKINLDDAILILFFVLLSFLSFWIFFIAFLLLNITTFLHFLLLLCMELFRVFSQLWLVLLLLPS